MSSSVQFRPSSDNDTQHFTTNTGMPVWNNVSSMTVGQRGPVLLEGVLLLFAPRCCVKQCPVIMGVAGTFIPQQWTCMRSWSRQQISCF